MDHLRKVWGWFQRQHFWVLTVVAIAIALFFWWRGVNKLFAEYNSNKSKIESEFANTQRVRNAEFHANDTVQEKQNEEITNQQASVRALWQQLYDRQTAAVLKWPSNLSKEFHDFIGKLKFGEDIPRNLRAHYNNYIRDHFPELPKIVDALPAPEGPAGSSYGGPEGGAAFDPQSLLTSGRGGPGYGEGGEEFEEPEFTVMWQDQQLIRDELAPRSTPSAKRIWKTQEDLWVYEALLTIIAKTNKAAGADRFSNAPIRVIESMEVGRLAAQASRGKGRIDMVVAPSAGGEGMEGMGPDMSGMGPPGGDMMMDRGGMEGGYGPGMEGMAVDPNAADAQLFNNRYVDGNGPPIADPGDGSLAAFGSEFKRLPVRMRLWMDQRWLPHLIAECANAPLQVEVQEVRINPPADGGGPGMSGGMGGYGRGMGGPMSGGGTEVQDMTPDANPNMKSVVIQGIVYIFNPPTDEAAANDASLAAQ